MRVIDRTKVQIDKLRLFSILGQAMRLIDKQDAFTPFDFSESERGQLEATANRILGLIQPSLFTPEETPHA